MPAAADPALRCSCRGYWRGSRSSLGPVPAETPSPAAAAGAPSEPELLSDGELDAIEDELAQAERTLGLLADDDIDPAAATDWLPQEAEPIGEAVARAARER